MLDLHVLQNIKLTRRPVGQMAVGYLLRGNYRFPPTRTAISIEGLDRLPSSGRVYLAMNHTDRFNYFPFQVELWKQHDQFTATWVKGKYYNHPVLSRLMVATNNIPTPSRGYILSIDARAVLGAPPPGELYRVLRTALDEGQSLDQARENAEAAGVRDTFEKVVRTPRDILGRGFDPERETYLEAVDDLFHQMMEHFVELNIQAFDLGLHVLVFPEGTRSRRLSTGRPGLAQMAVRTAATIVPIGCNGSDSVYPGDIPWSGGGEIVYRIGEPMTPEGELAPFQVDEEFKPFTAEADPYHEVFDQVTELVMTRIAGLLDERHLPSADSKTEVDGTRRFM